MAGDVGSIQGRGSVYPLSQNQNASGSNANMAGDIGQFMAAVDGVKSSAPNPNAPAFQGGASLRGDVLQRQGASEPKTEEGGGFLKNMVLLGTATVVIGSLVKTIRGKGGFNLKNLGENAKFWKWFGAKNEAKLLADDLKHSEKNKEAVFDKYIGLETTKREAIPAAQSAGGEKAIKLNDNSISAESQAIVNKDRAAKYTREQAMVNEPGNYATDVPYGPKPKVTYSVNNDFVVRALDSNNEKVLLKLAKNPKALESLPETTQARLRAAIERLPA